MFHFTARTGAAFIAGAVALASPAGAATYTSEQLLRHFNLITFGDARTNQDVEGRLYVGGDLISGGMQVNIVPTPSVLPFDDAVIVGNVTGAQVNANNKADITVGGNVANTTLELNGGGTARIGGTLSANANQGVKLTQQATLDPDFADRFPLGVEAEFKATSASLASLAGVGATAIGNQLVFAATPNSDGLTVYDIDLSVFSSVGELKFDLSGANSVIVNVSGLGGTFSDNFVGGDTPFAELASKVVWNFHEATALHFDTAIWGTVLAPFAHVTNATPIEGTLVANTVDLKGEMHVRPWQGVLPNGETPAAVPVPAALPLLGAGLGALAFLRRRRARA